MSDATKNTLEEALADHIRDESEDGAMITAYVIYAAYINSEIPEGRTGYRAIVPAGQPYHSTLGLAHSMTEDLYSPVEDDD